VDNPHLFFYNYFEVRFMKLLTLGRIIRTKGLDGTFKVNSSTDFALERYEEGNKVFIQNEKTKELKEVTGSVIQAAVLMMQGDADKAMNDFNAKKQG
jgi:ribosomal 30S subunit maturation factor RimM